MYESPIKINIEHTIDNVIKDVNDQMDDRVICSVSKELGVEVDKKELFRALFYDRNQYEKGYADGQREAHKHGHWITTGYWEDVPINKCSVCGVERRGIKRNYCANCGAKMDEEVEE